MPLRAQTFSEWFFQGSTQKKYLVQQVAALQVYMIYLKDGYQVVRSGLNTVRDMTHGEFSLHTLYINSLKQANPVIRDDKRVKAIMDAYGEIRKGWDGLDEVSGTGNSGASGALGAPALSVANRAYVDEVKQLVMHSCAGDLDELALLVTAGKVQMTDDERLMRLAKVYKSMLDKAAFTRAFCADVALMAGQRLSEQGSIQNFRRFYEGD